MNADIARPVVALADPQPVQNTVLATSETAAPAA